MAIFDLHLASPPSAPTLSKTPFRYTPSLAPPHTPRQGRRISWPEATCADSGKKYRTSSAFVDRVEHVSSDSVSSAVACAAQCQKPALKSNMPPKRSLKGPPRADFGAPKTPRVPISELRKLPETLPDSSSEPLRTSNSPNQAEVAPERDGPRFATTSWPSLTYT